MKDNVVIIKTAEWMSALETIESQKERIAELIQRIKELEKELDWCKHAGRVMTELHDEKCKRITELQAMVIDKEVE